MIHFDGFSLLLIFIASSVGYALGWRRCQNASRSRVANDAAVIARARREI